jgi:hypothetical protein
MIAVADSISPHLTVENDLASIGVGDASAATKDAATFLSSNKTSTSTSNSFTRQHPSHLAVENDLASIGVEDASRTPRTG